MSMASILATSSILQQPPDYILKNWHRHEPTNHHDKYLLQQTFIIAPDGAVPSSKLRQRLRNIYEERIKASIIVHYDPWN